MRYRGADKIKDYRKTTNAVEFTLSHTSTLTDMHTHTHNHIDHYLNRSVSVSLEFLPTFPL